MLQQIISFQHDIYLAFAARIQAFASGGGWSIFLLYLPMGILFGAAHALTPGHSKTILATYLVGSPLGVMRGMAISFALSFTHVTMSVVIALLALPLVSISLGSVGRAPLLDDLSRGLLGLIGLWMLYRAFRQRRHTHHRREGLAVGVMAGLVPCPLTLFVMTFAISRGVPQAGIAFAVTMMLGVAIVLAIVAAGTVFFRQSMMHVMRERAEMLNTVARVLEGLAGILLVLFAARELALR